MTKQLVCISVCRNCMLRYRWQYVHWIQITMLFKKEEENKANNSHSLVYYADSNKQGVYLLSRQATRGSAMSLGSRYTSWGCSLAGVMARWRQSLLMYWTNATSISKLHFRQAFWAWRVSIQVHLVQSTAAIKQRPIVKFSHLLLVWWQSAIYQRWPGFWKWDTRKCSMN